MSRISRLLIESPPTESVGGIECQEPHRGPALRCAAGDPSAVAHEVLHPAIPSRMSKHIVIVLNGKGRVGKSFLVVQLVQDFTHRGIAYGAIDINSENS